MSVTADPHRSSLLGGLIDKPEWWFVRLYTGGFAGADTMTSELIPPLVAHARELGIHRWFYMRYMDPSGPHIRLRVKGTRDVLDVMESGYRALVTDLETALAQKEHSHPFVMPVDEQNYLGTASIGGSGALYEPEYTKYGGIHGVDLAEQLFEFSSDLGVWATGRFDKTPDRAGLAALLLFDAVHSGLDAARFTSVPPGADWQGYWDQHLKWWTGDFGANAPRVRKTIQSSVETRMPDVRCQLDRLAAMPSVTGWRRNWRAAVHRYVVRAMTEGIDLTPMHLIFHQGHMMTNRLGFLPREEALLGQYARLCRREDGPVTSGHGGETNPE